LLEIRLDVLRGPGAGGRCLAEQESARVELPALGESRTSARETVPGLLARAVGLGPRPRSLRGGILLTGRAALERLLDLHADDAVRGGGDAARDAVRAVFTPADLPDVWVRALALLAGTRVSHWRVQVFDAGAALDALEILDGGSSGLWAAAEHDPGPFAGEVDDSDELDGVDGIGVRGTGAEEEAAAGPVVSLAPTTPTAVWSWLSRLAG
jgi:hypothetical protein